MRPGNLKTKIFLDGGDPSETKQIINLLGFLDGQTTNPTLIAKNPEAKTRLEKGNKFTKEEILEFYKGIVKELSLLIPEGSVSVEVPADKNTTSKEMFESGKEMFSWIPNAHIKFPIIREGLAAAEQAIKEDIKVNMTLCFSQEQAAAVYAATRGSKDVFVSPFVGRLDDKEENGMDLIKNILEMFKESDHHAEVLSASVRNLNHFLYSLSLGCDIITAPFAVLKEWAINGMQIPDENFKYNSGNLKNIPYEDLDLNQIWNKFDIAHELTSAGLERFANDWNALIG